LAIFIPSQFAVSLLGEGVRDLSKHLAAAQYSLDLLSVLIALQIATYGCWLAMPLGKRFFRKRHSQSDLV
jgi:hypothetical protein